MRFVAVLVNDIRYQMKYGFYFLYAFFTVFYIGILLVCPIEYRKVVASIIVLTDPAMLGSFFIGGIWLLEKSEGLHSYWGISPLRPLEYILSKAISLAIISTLSASLIVIFGLGVAINYFALLISIFIGSMIFTIIGLFVASYTRSVNHYLLLVAPLEVFVSLPPILAVFGLTHPVLDILPGMALWRVIGYSVGMTDKIGVGLYLMLGLWLVIAILRARGRIPKAMEAEGGGKA